MDENLTPQLNFIEMYSTILKKAKHTKAIRYNQVFLPQTNQFW